MRQILANAQKNPKVEYMSLHYNQLRSYYENLSMAQINEYSFKCLIKKWNDTMFMNNYDIALNKDGFKIDTMIVSQDKCNRNYNYLYIRLNNEISPQMLHFFAIAFNKHKHLFDALENKLKCKAYLLPIGSLMITFNHAFFNIHNEKIITFGNKKCNLANCSMQVQKMKRCRGVAKNCRKIKCVARYCSRKHQKCDWKQQHRLVCCRK